MISLHSAMEFKIKNVNNGVAITKNILGKETWKRNFLNILFIKLT